MNKFQITIHNRQLYQKIPDPRGKKSLPTTLSNTEDFPELWPPTTAIAGRESQRVGSALDSPWSPKAVQAL